MSKEEKLNKKYPFQFYTFSNITMLEQNGFNFDNYSFNLQHEHELYIGNINGLICRHDMGYPLRMLKYLKQDPDTMVKRKLTFLLPENYKENIGNLKGLRENVIKVFDLPCFNDQINILTYKVDNSNIMEKIEELKNMPKFDVAIMNPPYEKSLHLKILEKVIPIANKVVNISPIRWLQDPLAKYKKHSDYFRFQNSILKFMTSCNIIKHEEATVQFKALFSQDLAITTYDYIGGYDYDNVPFLNKSKTIFLKIINKTKINNIFSICEANKIDGIRVKVQELKNSAPSSNNLKTINIYDDNKNPAFYDLMYKNFSSVFNNGYGIDNTKKWWSEYGNKNKYTKAVGEPMPWSIKFNTINEAQNFEASCFTLIFKYCMFLLKLDQHVPLKFLPWMHDYTQPWTNQRFCNYFGITGFISDTEAVPGSEWEEILNCMKDFN